MQIYVLALVLFIASLRSEETQNFHSSETVDALGNTTWTTYDSVERKANIIQTNAQGDLLGQQESYYDENTNCIQVEESQIIDGVLQNIIIRKAIYNNKNQLIKLVEAAETNEEQVRFISYNSSGQVETVTKPDGVKLYCEYDSHDLMTRLFSSDRSIDYLYIYNPQNRLTESKDLIQGSKTTFRYNSQNNLVSETLGNGYTLSYAYDALNQMTQLTLPDGSTIHYTYEGSLLKEVSRRDTSGKEHYCHQYVEYQDHLIQEKPIVSNSVLLTKYDSLKRCNKITLHTPNTKLSEILSYDSLGNITASSIDNFTVQYLYDDLNQLISEKDHSYSYDSLGNRLEKNNITCTINALHQLLRCDNTQYTYDANGNLITKSQNGKQTHYRYDALDRLVDVIDQGMHTTYTYDNFDRRINKNGVIHYLYHGQNEIGTIENGQITQLRILGMGIGAEIGASVALELNGVTYMPVYNHNGHAVALFDFMGNRIETYRYSAFGEESIFDEQGQSKVNSINPWRYSSKRKDPETGFINFGMRYYDPEVARWITLDPIRYEDGPNPYAYLHNNPLNHCDLYGLYTDKVDLVKGELRNRTSYRNSNNTECTNVPYKNKDSSSQQSKNDHFASANDRPKHNLRDGAHSHTPFKDNNSKHTNDITLAKKSPKHDTREKSDHKEKFQNNCKKKITVAQKEQPGLKKGFQDGYQNGWPKFGKDRTLSPTQPPSSSISYKIGHASGKFVKMAEELNEGLEKLLPERKPGMTYLELPLPGRVGRLGSSTAVAETLPKGMPRVGLPKSMPVKTPKTPHVSAKPSLAIQNFPRESIKVEGFAKHAVDRAIQRGIKPDSILDALKNPLKKGEVKIDIYGRPSQRLIGKNAEVVINPANGRIISVNATSTKKAEQLLKKASK